MHVRLQSARVASCLLWFCRVLELEAHAFVVVGIFHLGGDDAVDGLYQSQRKDGEYSVSRYFGLVKDTSSRVSRSSSQVGQSSSYKSPKSSGDVKGSVMGLYGDCDPVDMRTSVLASFFCAELSVLSVFPRALCWCVALAGEKL